MQMTTEQMKTFFRKLESCESSQFMELVEERLDDTKIELICDHIEDFYGITDDEEIGMLAQVMITGVLLGQESKTPMNFIKSTESEQPIDLQ